MLSAHRRQEGNEISASSPSHLDGAALGDDVADVPLSRFWRPQFWPAWLFVAWLRLTAFLPLRWAIKLHKALGRVAGKLRPRRRMIVRRNIEICLPHLTPEEIDALSAEHFANIAAMLAEIAISWFGDPRQLAGLMRIEGREHLDAAVARGKGVLLYSGHFTPLEICVPVVKGLVPLYAFMFRRRNNPLLNELQRRYRRKAAHVSVVNDDVRSLMRILRKNATVWYASDQVRIGTGGVLLPFFGEPAMTSTAASRLARVTGVAVIPLFFCRLTDDSGYVLRFQAPLDDFPTSDAAHDTARLTAILEDFVRECPAQYFWIHRKFKGRPQDLPQAYGSSES